MMSFPDWSMYPQCPFLKTMKRGLDTCSDFAEMVYSTDVAKKAIRISRNLLIGNSQMLPEERGYGTFIHSATCCC
jgi:hypothetical protein